MGALILGIVVVVLLVLIAFKSTHSVGALEVGLVSKRFGFKKLSDDNAIAFHGEAGYQAQLLMPGLRFKLWPMFGVKKYPLVQVPAGEIGVVIAQVGAPLPIGAKSAVYHPDFGNFSSVTTFVERGGQKGVQRPVLPPGTLLPIHPVAFLVLTASTVYGLPVSPDLVQQSDANTLTPESFGLTGDMLRVVVIAPEGEIDLVGVVTTLEGEPLPSGDIASRLGAFEDITAFETAEAAGTAVVTDADRIELILGSKNNLHNNYQDYQAFLDAGGKIGLQHDPLLYGAYLLNPFLVRVDLVPMLVVNQGEVAVIKAFVGLPTLDTSGAEFKFGSIVRPGHRGIWREALRTVAQAMRAHPELIGGTRDRVDTDLMRTGPGVVAKGGAEGYFAMGSGDGLGVAFKILDGDAAHRARSAVAVAVGQRLGWLDRAALVEYGPSLPIRNWAGRQTGEVRVAPSLDTTRLER